MRTQSNYSRGQLNHFSGKILQAAFKVHSNLGPGLLEGAYESCLVYELTRFGLNVESQATLPVHYGDMCVDIGYRVDLVVENCILVELKSVEKVIPQHSPIINLSQAQRFHTRFVGQFQCVTTQRWYQKAGK